MDYQSQNNQQNGFGPNGTYQNSGFKLESALSRTSKTMGIIGICSSFFGIGFIFGAFAIIFAIISKDRNNMFTRNGKIGLFLGTLSILFSVLLYVYIFVDPTAHAMLNETCRSFYGVTFDELFQQALNGEAPTLNSIGFSFRSFF